MRWGVVFNYNAGGSGMAVSIELLWNGRLTTKIAEAVANSVVAMAVSAVRATME